MTTKSEKPLMAAKVHAGWTHEHRESVSSTNTVLLADAVNITGNHWLRADVQTAGKGRRGRAWSSPGANLYASVLLINPATPAEVGSLPLVASLALHDAIEYLRPPWVTATAQIKWPNDLLIDGAKCSGILVESRALPNGVFAVVLGFGVNIGVFPKDGLNYEATSLGSNGWLATPEELFVALTNAFAERLSQWKRGTAFHKLRDAWLDRAARVGTKIVVNLPTEQISGQFVTIDDSGFLVLDTGSAGVRLISAGDVFFEA
ncbi:MAG: biotin--[acetyl-CoA-carboxylase] ligase [Pseudomonadota bacterium]